MLQQRQFVASIPMFAVFWLFLGISGTSLLDGNLRYGLCALILTIVAFLLSMAKEKRLLLFR